MGSLLGPLIANLFTASLEEDHFFAIENSISMIRMFMLNQKKWTLS